MIFMNERTFGKAAKSEALEQADSVAAQARPFGRASQRRFGVLALEGTAGLTSGTGAAGLRERSDDMISNPELGDVGPDFSDDPGDLVAENSRHRNDVMGSEQQVGVTEPGGSHVDQNFPSDGCGNVDLFEIESATGCVDDKRLHVRPSHSRFERIWRPGGMEFG